MNHRGNDKESQSDNVKLKHGGVALYIDFLDLHKKQKSDPPKFK